MLHVYAHLLVLFISFSSAEVLFRNDGGECPEHWVQASWVDMGCLLFNSTKLYTWEAANNYCQSEAASLLEIHTEEQFQFLQMQLNVLEDHEGAKVWWTGGTDIGREGQWFWISSLTPVEDLMWHSGYPSTSTGSNCMALHPTFEYEAFNDGCGATYLPICQKIMI